MKATKHLITSLFLAGGLALAATPALHAEPAQARAHMQMSGDAKPSCPMAGQWKHHGGKHHSGKRHGGQQHGMMGSHGMQPHFLRGLDLTEAQRDKVFDILYPLVPEQRAHFKAVRDLKKQQHDLVLSKDFDAGKLKKLVEAENKAKTDFRVKMATAHNKVYQQLTDEQKAKIAERKARRMK